MTPQTLMTRTAIDALPIGLYRVALDGTFIDANARTRKLLGLSKKSLRKHNILEFYMHPEQRDALLKELLAAEAFGNPLQNQSVQFKVGTTPIFVQMSCSSIRDPQTGEIEGYTGCITDITAEEESRRVLNLVTEGVYRADGNDELVYVNQATCRLYGYDTPAQMLGLKMERLFSNAAEAQKVRQIVEREGSGDGVWEMQRQDATPFFAALTSVLGHARDGGRHGHEGTIRDVTGSEQLRLIINNVPIAQYMVRTRDGIDTIAGCNDVFARLFDFESVDELIGMRVEDIHGSTKHYDEYLTKLYAADTLDEPLLGHTLRTRTKKGKRLFIEINAKVLRGYEDNIIGRVGVVRDVTDEAPLVRRIQELTYDIGQVLHTYSATLQMLQTSLTPTTAALRRSTLDRRDHTWSVDLWDELRRTSRELGGLVGAFINGSSDMRRRSALSEADWARLKECQGWLVEFDGRLPYKEFWAPTLRDVAVRTARILETAKRQIYERSIIRDILYLAWHLERVCCLIGLTRVEDALVTMDYQVRSLRDYVTESVRSSEPLALHPVDLLLGEAVSNVFEYARGRKVTIKRKTEDGDLQVRGSERELVRAFANVLHNAIKYSYARDSESGRWIDVRSECIARGGVELIKIEIEDYGVAIPQDEIDQGLIWQLGFRGRLANDRRRTGTGIGLTDAKRIVERCHGEISITSRPVGRHGHREHITDEQTEPYLTTVMILLPVHRTSK